MIIAVAGWRGLGTTTAALALATCLGDEGRPAWLVEADPAGGVLSGRMQLSLATVGGLERVAFPGEATPADHRFDGVAQRCGDVMVISAPTDPFRAHACHRPRVPWVAALRDLEGDVVVDVGRLRSGGPTWPLLTAADVVLLVSSPEIAAIVSACEWLQAAGRIAAGELGMDDGAGRLLVVDVPGTASFTPDALRRDLGADLVGWLPWDTGSVDLLHRGAHVGDRRLRRSELVHAAKRTLDTLRPSLQMRTASAQ